MNFKSILSNRVLPELKAASPYFTTAAIKQRAQQLAPEINLDSWPCISARPPPPA